MIRTYITCINTLIIVLNVCSIARTLSTTTLKYNSTELNEHTSDGADHVTLYIKLNQLLLCQPAIFALYRNVVILFKNGLTSSLK